MFFVGAKGALVLFFLFLLMQLASRVVRPKFLLVPFVALLAVYVIGTTVLGILSQDFQNMAEVQRGMKSRGFPGARPSPVAEIPVTHFHEVLAQYMGSGPPRPIG